MRASLPLALAAVWAVITLAHVAGAAADCEPVTRCIPSMTDCQRCSAGSFEADEVPAVVAGPDSGVDFRFVDDGVTVTIVMKEIGTSNYTKIGGHFNALTSLGVPFARDEILGWMQARVDKLKDVRSVQRIFITGKARQWSNNLLHINVRLSYDREYLKMVGPTDQAKTLVDQRRERAEARLKALDPKDKSRDNLDMAQYLQNVIAGCKKAGRALELELAELRDPYVDAVLIDHAVNADKLCVFLRQKLGLTSDTPCRYDGGFSESRRLQLDKVGDVVQSPSQLGVFTSE
jgi:hypothetical protein